jgi:tRNA pseudouridine55 synthase
MTPGFLLIDKPAGPTSHDVVSRVRRITGEKRVGHAGTLDPFASGLLLVGVGREATQELGNFVGLDKTYEAVFVLGQGSDTDDGTGVITTDPDFKPPTEPEIRAAMSMFVGTLNQIPPSYAAIKIGGVKMYDAARAGKPLIAPPRAVTIYSFDLVDTVSQGYGGVVLGTPTTGARGRRQSGPSEDVGVARSRGPIPSSELVVSIRVNVHCTSGTYIRSLARDLGKALGTLGLVSELRRTSIGPFSVNEAISMPSFGDQAPAVLAIESCLSRLPPSATIGV